MIEQTIDKIREEFDATMGGLDKKIEQYMKSKEAIIREYESLETHQSIISLTDYLRLVAVDASDLLTMRDELIKKVELKENDFKKLNESLMELKAKSTASDIYITNLKQTIAKLKTRNADLQDQVKCDETPLILELFKNLKSNT